MLAYVLGVGSVEAGEDLDDAALLGHEDPSVWRELDHHRMIQVVPDDLLLEVRHAEVAGGQRARRSAGRPLGGPLGAGVGGVRRRRLRVVGPYRQCRGTHQDARQDGCGEAAARMWRQSRRPRAQTARSRHWLFAVQATGVRDRGSSPPSGGPDPRRPDSGRQPTGSAPHRTPPTSAPRPVRRRHVPPPRDTVAPCPRVAMSPAPQPSAPPFC